MSKLDEMLDRRNSAYDGESTLTNGELEALIECVRAADAWLALELESDRLQANHNHSLMALALRAADKADKARSAYRLARSRLEGDAK